MTGGKSLTILLLIILFSHIAIAQTPPTDQTAHFNRYVSQEGQKTRDYIKNELDQQIKANNEEIQEQINQNKAVFFKELERELNIWTFRASIILFSTIVMALVTYQLIMIKVRRKYKNLNLRIEQHG